MAQGKPRVKQGWGAKEGMEIAFWSSVSWLGKRFLCGGKVGGAGNRSFIYKLY